MGRKSRLIVERTAPKPAPVETIFDATIVRYAQLAKDAASQGDHEAAREWRHKITERAARLREEKIAQ